MTNGYCNAHKKTVSRMYEQHGHNVFCGCCGANTFKGCECWRVAIPTDKHLYSKDGIE